MSDATRALDVLFERGKHVLEVRVLGLRFKRIASGYYDDFDKAADDIDAYNGSGAVYVTLNPVRPDLLARAHNRIREIQNGEPTTSDHDVLHRRFLLVDADPVRPAGISSSEAEHVLAFERAGSVRDWLSTQGWAVPVECDSGNGAHLLYMVNLPNDKAATSLVESVLKVLSEKFSDDKVKIDTTVGNAARITRMYGTVNKKGDNTSQRPHRQSTISYTPASLEVTPRHKLEELVVAHAPPSAKPTAATSPTAASSPTSTITTNSSTTSASAKAHGLDLDAWFAAHRPWFDARGIEHTASPWQGGRKFVFNKCPWNPDHTNGSAYVVQLANGALSAGCKHNGCKEAGNNWHKLRRDVEPARQGRREDQAGETGAALIIGDTLPNDAAEKHAQFKRTGTYFHGTAKGAAPDGEPLSSPAAYDRAYVHDLVRKKITDRSVLATAVACRPDGHARQQGHEYIVSLVEAALAKAAPATKMMAKLSRTASEASICRFAEVERFIKVDADPPWYKLFVDGVEIKFSSKQVTDNDAFRCRYVEATNTMPGVPRGRSAKDHWDVALAEMLEHLEIEKPAADATRLGALEVAIERTLSNINLVEDFANRHAGHDLAQQTRGKLLLFTVDAIVSMLAGHDTKPTREEIAPFLIKLGCKHGRPVVQLDGKLKKVPSECWYVRPSKELLRGQEADNVAGASPTVRPFSTPVTTENPPPSAVSQTSSSGQESVVDDEMYV